MRPLGDVIVLMPPFAMSEDELHRLVAITAEAIAVATRIETCAGAAVPARLS